MLFQLATVELQYGSSLQHLVHLLVSYCSFFYDFLDCCPSSLLDVTYAVLLFYTVVFSIVSRITLKDDESTSPTYNVYFK